MDEIAEASWSGAVKAESVSPVACATCLSSNRTLHPMIRMMHLSGVCNGVKLTAEDSVCWECRALLLKFAQFKARAVNSKSTLTVWLQINQFTPPDQQLALLQSLSTLKRCSKTSYDLMLNDNKESCGEPESGPGTVLAVEFVDAEVKNEPTSDHEETEIFGNLGIDKTEQSEDEAKDANKNQLQTLIQKLIAKPKRKFTKKTLEDTKKSAENNDEVDTDTETSKEENYKVKVMTKAELLVQRERARNYDRYKRSAFKCEDCIKYFTSQNLLDKHMDLHSESVGMHCCSICKLRFIGEGSLSLHVKTHYRYYECRECGLRNPQRVNIIRHWHKHHNTAVKCTICKHEFKSSAHLKKHMNSHLDEMTCNICNKLLKNKYLLGRHMLIHSDDLPLLNCGVCHKEFRGDWRLRAHKRVHENTANENAYCAECGVQFKNVYLYRVHLKTTARHVDPADRKFECSDCGKRFVSKSVLKLHIELVHLKKSNHTCDICGQSFNARLMLTRHKREKHSDRIKNRILCDICGKGFTVRKCLIEHKNIHSGARPFSCRLCSASFSYSAALYNHTRLVHLKVARSRRT